ncbi:hypothetical protein FDI40_gp103 [Agrobacterium phage Atu_ph07]|uniref:Uncharacterized protein n=1 Tax=Agrobacterium phage Atu_ph07 TaxID=2024264 RepID=A0A2L0UZE0_9CAUD|nr:hypothetical protein FDI40_gp103 [Agrobacterium phage Atu_ph07]AUZ94904.1 hypothetical protein [Agrobacterium phage Atu_ph07]
MIKVCLSHTSFDRQVSLPAVPRVDETVSIDHKEYRVYKVEHSIMTTVGSDDIDASIVIYIV